MNRRLALILGVLIATGATVTFVSVNSKTKSKATRVFDRRCRGGCTDSAFFRVLPGGSTPPSLVAAGTIQGSKGQAISVGRSGTRLCSTGATFDPTQLARLGSFIGGGSGVWSKAGTAQPTTTTNAFAAPDGSLTATLAAYGATPGGSDRGLFYQNVVIPSAGTYTWSFQVQGVSGSGTLYFDVQGSSNTDSSCSFVAGPYTTCSMTVAGLSAGTVAFVIGPDRLVFPAETSQPAQSVYLANAKVEPGSSATAVVAGNNILFNTINANAACVQTSGVSSEEAVAQLLTAPQAFDNAAWTKTSVTVTADQAMSPDGTYDADKLAFTGASSITQGAAVAATTATTDLYLRTASGTVSTISVALKNTTTSTVLSTTTPTLTTQWQRVSRTSSTGITSGNTLALLVSGTGGETVYAWQGSLTAKTFLTTPVPSSTSADTFNYGTQAVTSASGSASICLTPEFTGNSPTGSYILSKSDGSIVFFQSGGGDSNMYFFDGASVTVPANWVAGTKKCFADFWNGNVRILQNLTDGWSSAGPAFTPTFSGIVLSTLSPFDGDYTDLCIGPTSSCRAQPVMLAAIGDSLTQGVETVGTEWPHVLQASMGNSWAVINDGVSGNTVPDMQTRWTATIRPEKPGIVVFLGGINDVNADVSAATLWGNIQTLADQARADGAVVHLVTLLPEGNSGNWSAPRQTVITTVNASILSYCTTNGLRCVDAYTGMGQGGSPTKLNPTYDHGDGLHLNTAGNVALAALVQAQL